MNRTTHNSHVEDSNNSALKFLRLAMRKRIENDRVSIKIRSYEKQPVR